MTHNLNNCLLERFWGNACSSKARVLEMPACFAVEFLALF